MLTFRQKIFIAYFLLFLVFIGLIFPFATYFVNRTIMNSMIERADELLGKIQSAPTDEALIRRVKDQKFSIFFRVSIISNNMQVLYDSHAKRLLGPKFTQEYIVDHPEVIGAFEKGIAYNIDYSDLLGQKFYYMGKAFDFHGHTYVICTAVPYTYVSSLIDSFEVGFFVLISAALFFLSILTWVIINQINNLTRERNEKSAILESLVEGVVAVDEKMAIAYANESACKMFAKPAQQLLKASFAQVGQQRCYDLLAECQHQGRILTDTLQHEADNKLQYWDVIAVPKGQGQGAILVLQDQSSHYRIIEMRKEFIANASHELKTPITIIRGFAETLHDNPDLPKEIVADVTAKIVRNCNRMTHLIKDLLTLSDIENLPLSRLIDCDLNALLEQCRQTLLTVFPDAQVTIDNRAGSSSIIGNPSLLELAFINLLDNAAKYSTPPAQITVTLERDQEWIKISFVDRGIGIPSHAIDNIFQRFYTVDKVRSQKMGGSGLGLSIVKTIVQKHFGKISVTSREGKGSTFTILLPAPLEEVK